MLTPNTMNQASGLQTLTLTGLRFDANLGILAHEKNAPQPIQVDAELSLGAPPMLYALILAAAGNIMMTLTHYATGTAPVIFNSGYVTLGEWWIIGAIMSVVNLVVWIGAGLIWWKLLGYY